MSEILTYCREELLAQNGFWTATEIVQQGEMWRQAAADIESVRSELAEWLKPILRREKIKVVLTGAGTSAYIGEVLAPYLRKETGLDVTAISTTDVVACPDRYLFKSSPTLLISYGRSGSSPESVAAVEVVNQFCQECYHLVITCNPEGELALKASEEANSYAIVMPKGTLDNSFAMTSSFTSMLVSTVCIFKPDVKQLELLSHWANNFVQSDLTYLHKSANSKANRLVFLAAGELLGYAKEASLKLLELTAGEVVSTFETPLGFRHGPKSIINENTEVVVMRSRNSHTKQYDQDLLKELKQDKQAQQITELHFTELGAELDDIWCGLAYIVYAQTYAFFRSMKLGCTPDNPCPTGEVNRVVQGVTIYPYIED